MRSPADAVYGAIRDYHRRQSALTGNFRDYRVEEGGLGDGTVVSYTFHAGRRQRAPGIPLAPSHSHVTAATEPESAGRTTQVVWNVELSSRSRSVRFDASSDARRRYWMERTFAPLGLRRIYGQVLEQLDQLAS